MKYEIYYLDYKITASAGLYWIEGFKLPYQTLREAKEAIEFIIDSQYYLL